MGTGFKVNPQSLRDLADKVEGVGHALDSLDNQRGISQELVEYGRVDVDHFPSQAFLDAGKRLDSFVGDWSNGISRVKGNAETAAKFLRQAAQTYEDAEAALSGALSPKSP